ncbi:unnamed protein product [Aureobasidium pullulans]|nr:unnamed protein product [Aureobasidium pullulans]
MTPAHPQAASRPRLILRSDSFTHEDLSAAFAASASQPRTKDLKIRIAQKDETPAPPPSPTEAFSSHLIELGLGEEWFGVSRSTTAADKATHKRS